jgi:hypothetical protein
MFSWMLPSAFLISCFAAAGLKAQQLPPPIKLSNPRNLQYSSPYGPRHISDYQFHYGVDYRYGLGTPYYAVEGGTITALHHDGLNDWLITIEGSHTFDYIHMFDNSWMAVDASPPDNDGNPIYAQACLNSSTPLPISSGVSNSSCANKTDFVTLELTPCPDQWMIVFWQDFDKDIASKVLSPCDISGFPLGFDKVGGVTPTSHVSQGDLIGIVGHSGVAALAGPHLHLQVDHGHESPFECGTRSGCSWNFHDQKERPQSLGLRGQRRSHRDLL